MNAHVDDWYGKQMYASRMGRYTTDVEQAFIGRTLHGSRKPLKILDVGGGGGRHSRFVAGLGHDPVVLERDSKAIAALLDEGVDIPVFQADAMALPVATSSFDAVLTIEVAICTSGVNDYNVAYFSEVARVLKEGGLFIFTAFNKNSYFNLIRRFRKNRPYYEDLYYSESAGTYRRKLHDAGFDVIGCSGFRWPPFPRGSSSRLVPVAAFLESLFLLRFVTRFSPWLCFAAWKRS